MEKLRLILETSTLPGLSNISKNQNILIRIFWIVCLLGLNVVSAFYITNTLIGYYNYETITNIDIIHEDLPQFPTISICVDYLPNKTMDKIMLDCKFDYIECSYKDFSYERINNIILTVQACIRFNSGYNFTGNKVDILNSTYSGLQYGLVLDFMIPFNAYVYDHLQLIIQIHNSTMTYPSLFNHEIYLSSGSRSDFILSRQFISKLPAPYSQCIEDASLFTNNKTIIDFILNSNRSYSQTECM